MPLEFNTERLNRLFIKLVDKLHSQKLMENLGLLVERFIGKRTREGKDVEGRPFRPYSKEYARRRQRAGLQTHPVNLTWDEYTGMMRSIDHLVARTFDKVLVIINHPHKRKIALYHNLLGASKSKVIRHFFDVNAAETQKINAVVEDAVGKILRGLNNG